MINLLEKSENFMNWILKNGGGDDDVTKLNEVVDNLMDAFKEPTAMKYNDGSTHDDDGSGAEALLVWLNEVIQAWSVPWSLPVSREDALAEYQSFGIDKARRSQEFCNGIEKETTDLVDKIEKLYAGVGVSVENITDIINGIDGLDNKLTNIKNDVVAKQGQQDVGGEKRQ